LQGSGLLRSALDKAPQDLATKDAPVIEAINSLVEKRPRWGFWKSFKRAAG
jgi:putative transposase